MDRQKSSSTKTVPHDIALLGNCHRESSSRSGGLQSAVGIERFLWQTPVQSSSVLGTSTATTESQRYGVSTAARIVGLDNFT
jgi:hypothetical protein